MSIDHGQIACLLAEHGLMVDESERAVLLAGDGSDRRFCRLSLCDGKSVIIVVPPKKDQKTLLEAESYYAIGTHLHRRGVAVPELYGFDKATGVVIAEDLGNTLLQQIVGMERETVQIYQQVIDQLVQLQISGVKGFQSEMCWDTPVYDRQLMLEREARYFEHAFCLDFAGLSFDRSALEREFEMIINEASSQPTTFLLHRDFQSRNLMLHQGRIRIIDFQGARFGPLAYDLASLLIDPYVGLSAAMRNELLQYYILQVGKRLDFDPESFLQGYYYIALLRNLQIIGAFSFLYQKKGKDFFKDYLKPSVHSLLIHLQEPTGAALPSLRDLAEVGLVWLDDKF